MFITEAKLRNIIKQVLVDAQLIEDDKSIEPVPEGWSVARQPQGKFVPVPSDWHDMHPDKIRGILNSETRSPTSFEDSVHEYNDILLSTIKPKSTGEGDPDLFEKWLALTVENRKLRKDLSDAHNSIADKIELIHKMELENDEEEKVYYEKIEEIEGLLTRAQVVLEGLTSGDYFE